jgi:hypothetical protein
VLQELEAIPLCDCFTLTERGTERIAFGSNVDVESSPAVQMARPNDDLDVWLRESGEDETRESPASPEQAKPYQATDLGDDEPTKLRGGVHR